MMNTPLILSTLSGHGGIVRLLLKANCDVNKTGKSVGKAVKPIQIAVTKETLEIRYAQDYLGAIYRLQFGRVSFSNLKLLFERFVAMSTALVVSHLNSCVSDFQCSRCFKAKCCTSLGAT